MTASELINKIKELVFLSKENPDVDTPDVENPENSDVETPDYEAIISEKENKIKELEELLSEKENKIKELEELLSKKENKIKELEALLAEKDDQTEKIKDLEEKVVELGKLPASTQISLEKVETKELTFSQQMIENAKNMRKANGLSY